MEFLVEANTCAVMSVLSAPINFQELSNKLHSIYTTSMAKNKNIKASAESNYSNLKYVQAISYIKSNAATKHKT